MNKNILLYICSFSFLLMVGIVILLSQCAGDERGKTSLRSKYGSYQSELEKAYQQATRNDQSLENDLEKSEELLTQLSDRLTHHTKQKIFFQNLVQQATDLSQNIADSVLRQRISMQIGQFAKLDRHYSSKVSDLELRQEQMIQLTQDLVNTIRILRALEWSTQQLEDQPKEAIFQPSFEELEQHHERLRSHF